MVGLEFFLTILACRALLSEKLPKGHVMSGRGAGGSYLAARGAGEVNVREGCSCVRVFSLGPSFPALPHPKVLKVFMRNLVAQCKMSLTHGH